jgi:hypothetical protein
VANKKDRHPKAYFDAARGYQSAADRLLLSIESGEKLLIRDPAYFLYAHALELALKACLLSVVLIRRVPVRLDMALRDSTRNA